MRAARQSGASGISRQWTELSVDCRQGGLTHNHVCRYRYLHATELEEASQREAEAAADPAAAAAAAAQAAEEEAAWEAAQAAQAAAEFLAEKQREEELAQVRARALAFAWWAAAPSSVPHRPSPSWPPSSLCVCAKEWRPGPSIA